MTVSPMGDADIARADTQFPAPALQPMPRPPLSPVPRTPRAIMRTLGKPPVRREALYSEDKLLINTMHLGCLKTGIRIRLRIDNPISCLSLPGCKTAKALA
jgi:hypothetical protein